MAGFAHSCLNKFREIVIMLDKELPGTGKYSGINCLQRNKAAHDPTISNLASTQVRFSWEQDYTVERWPLVYWEETG